MQHELLCGDEATSTDQVVLFDGVAGSSLMMLRTRFRRPPSPALAVKSARSVLGRARRRNPLGPPCVKDQIGEGSRRSGFWRARVVIGVESGQALRGGPAHVMGPAESFQGPDDAGGDVDLAGSPAVAGAGGVGVVQVVPRLAHRQDRQRPEVRGFALRGEGAIADHVADRVDRPGDVVQDRDAHESGPEQRGERTPPGHGDQAAEQRHCGQAGPGEQREQPTDRGNVAVGQQIGDETGGIGVVATEQPAQMGMEEPARERGWRTAEQPRGVWIAFLVGEGVVAAVVRGPGNHVTLQGEAAGDRETVAQAAVGLERAMSEMAVESGCHAQRGYQVEPGGESDVEPGKAPPSCQRHGGDQGEHRQDGEHPDKQLFMPWLGHVEDRLGSGVAMDGAVVTRCGTPVSRRCGSSC
jgi:hypothetical protein